MTTPLTGYNPKNPSSGVGGRVREATNMARVDKMAGSGTPAAPIHPAAQTAAKAAPKPSSYAPSAVAGNSVQSNLPVATPEHTYGSPIETSR